MLLIRRISDGEMMPWGWGIARVDLYMRRTTIVPMPLNLAIRLFWWLYYGVSVRWLPGQMVAHIAVIERANERMRNIAWHNSYRQGHEALDIARKLADQCVYGSKSQQCYKAFSDAIEDSMQPKWEPE